MKPYLWLASLGMTLLACNSAFSLTSQHFTESRLSGAFPVYSVPQLIALTEAEWSHRHLAIKGEFSFPIKRAATGEGREADYIYLDSEADYRSPTSLNVILLSKAAAQFREKFGTDGLAKLEGTTLTVHGLARHKQVKCNNGCPQDPKATHYFQTQVWVGDLNQIVSANITGK